MDSLNGARIIPINPDQPLCPPHKENCAHDAAKMPGYRRRDKSGKLKQKRGDSHIDCFEKAHLGTPKIKCPDDTHLSKLREVTGEIGMRNIVKKLKEMDSSTKSEINEVR
jgi:hypothetical protein